MDVLYTMYTRHHLTDADFVELMSPMFTPGSVLLLREVYSWTLSDMDVQDLNEEKYNLCKRIAEVPSILLVLFDTSANHCSWLIAWALSSSKNLIRFQREATSLACFSCCMTSFATPAWGSPFPHFIAGANCCAYASYVTPPMCHN